MSEVFVEIPFDRIVDVHWHSRVTTEPPPPYDQTTSYGENVDTAAPQPPHIFEFSDGAQGLGPGYRTVILTINTTSYWGREFFVGEFKFTFQVTLVDLDTGGVLLDSGPIACTTPFNVPPQANGPFTVTLPGATIAGRNLLPYLAIVSLDSSPHSAVGGVGCSFRMQATP